MLYNSIISNSISTRVHESINLDSERISISNPWISIWIISDDSNLLIQKEFDIEYLNGDEYNGEIKYNEGIFKHRSGFYIYLSKSEPMISSFSCKIYYPIRKKKDVEFFILNLKKIKKDGN